jgi:hypothetical protein
LLASTIACAVSSAFAQSNEMQVYGAELADQGEANVEINTNLSKTSGKSELKGRTLFRSLIEVAYGLSGNWEAGIKLPASHIDGNWYGNGLIGEAKYVAPHAGAGGYWGVEVELGSTTPFHEKRQWALELTPIIGYRSGNWHVIGNPGLSIASDGDDRSVLQFEPSARVGYQVTPTDAIGLEYFVEAGPLRSPLPRNQRNDVAMLAWDTKAGKSLINLGVGRGTTAVSPRWLAKLNVDIEFD